MNLLAIHPTEKNYHAETSRQISRIFFPFGNGGIIHYLLGFVRDGQKLLRHESKLLPHQLSSNLNFVLSPTDLIPKSLDDVFRKWEQMSLGITRSAEAQISLRISRLIRAFANWCWVPRILSYPRGKMRMFVDW